MGDRDDIPDDPAAAYRLELASLELNSKPHILMLTMLADDYKDTKAAEIADCIEQRLLQVTPDKKLPTLYLVDSICKNLSESYYIELFQRKIIRLFCHTFERVDEKIRHLLFKLRQTWNEVFSPEVLHRLDVSVKNIDSAWPWPKEPPKSENMPRNQLEPSKVRGIPPKSVTIPPISVTKNSDLGKQIISKQNEFLNLKREQIELELHNKILNNSNGDQLPANRNSKKPKNEMKRKLSVDQSNGSSKIRKKDSTEKSPKSSAVNVSSLPSKNDKPKLARRKSTQSKSQLSPAKLSKKNLSEIPVQLPPVPTDLVPLGSTHCKSVAIWNKNKQEDSRQRNQSLVASIKSRRSPPRRNSRSPPSVGPSSRSRISPLKSSSYSHDSSNQKPSTVQTTIPAPNVFAQPEMMFAYSKMPDSPTKLPDSWNTLPSDANAGFAMDRDYRQEFDSVISDAKNKLNTGAITSADHDNLVREAHRQFSEIKNSQNQFAPASAPQFAPHPLPVTAPPGHVPLLVEPHGSVVLYINNDLRKLYYVDNNTSVVLNAHPETPFDQLVSMDPSMLEPKQVYFSGMPVTVVIDPGTPNEQALLLEFNSRLASTFFLPTIGIPQRIMLGLPARELIVNGRPYQSSFGGPSVKVYFECDNSFHEFRLAPAQPNLKFSEEVRYDLWHKLVHDAKVKAGLPVAPLAPSNFDYGHAPAPVGASAVPFNGQQQVPQVQVPQVPFASFENRSVASIPSQPAPALPDINSLFSKLTAVGLLSKSKPSAGPNSEKTSKQSKRQRKESAPKRYLPLDISSLKSATQFAIDQLYCGLQCTNCSLRFSDDALKDETDSEGKVKKSRYARHLDWHFRQNRREKSKPGSALSSTSAAAHRRPWYYTTDLWILYKEVNDDIEEDSAGFFDANAVNSPSMLAVSGALATFDYSQFKDYISDFDSFIDSINCDTTSGDSRKPCTVLAETDASANTCAVCKEAFDLKWLEDEEEWRLVNAVRYMPDGDQSAARIYHPLCLKDWLPQEKGLQDKAQMDMEASLNGSISSHNDSIPALDTPVEEKMFSLNSDNRNTLIPGLDCELKTEENDSSMLIEGKDFLGSTQEDQQIEQPIKEEPNDHNGGVDSSSDVKEEENFEVKVIEYEIPIVALTKNESTEQEETVSEIGVLTFEEPTSDIVSELSPKRTVETEPQISPNKVQANAQPKRGGIVIKMKKSTTLPASPPASTGSPFTEVATLESGNVLAIRDSAVGESETSGVESRPEHISASNNDNKGNDAADVTDDAINGTFAGTELATSDAEPTGDAVQDGALPPPCQDEPLVRPLTVDQEQTSDKECHASESLAHLQGEPSTEVNRAATCAEVNTPPGIESPPSPVAGSASSCATPPPDPNYFSRGHETSSLCSIM